MTLVREKGSEVLTQFSIPRKGTWKNSAIHEVPNDAVYDSNNVYIREGKLRTRPGLNIISQPFSDADDVVIGGAMAVTPEEKVVYAFTPTKLAQFSDVTNVWEYINPPILAPFATSIYNVIDVAFIESSLSFNMLIAEESQVLKVKNNLGAFTSVVTGTNIPTAKSVCISASRVIALIPPHTIVWSRVLDHTTFNALSIVKRAQTADVGVCVRPLSALSFVLYKEYSIHTARAQAGIDEGTSFSFSEPIVVEGPGGIHAVVDINGSHMYMTKSGRIAIFDGTAYPQWIADGIWYYLQEDLDQDKAYLIRGVYDYRLNTVFFFYPKVGTAGGLTGMVAVNISLNLETEAEVRPHCFLGVTARPITHACTKRFDNEVNKAFMFGSPDEDENVHALEFDETYNLDGDTAFECHFQTGLQSMPDAKYGKFTVESFLERGDGYGTVNIEPVINNALENREGTIPDNQSQVINLESTPVNEFIGFDKNVRFFGLRYNWTSTNTVRYSGAVVYDSMLKRTQK